MSRSPRLVGRSREIASQVFSTTIATFETGKRSHTTDRWPLSRALEAAGVEFTDGDEPGVKLKAKGKKGKRPSRASVGDRLGQRSRM
jgi:hypothetical protein